MTHVAEAPPAVSASFAQRGRDVFTFAERATREDWEQEWQVPRFALGDFGPCWTCSPTWRVADVEAELGFFVDGLGFDVNAVFPEGRYAMLIAPGGSVTFAIQQATDEHPAIVPGSLTLEFMLADTEAAWANATARGVHGVTAPWVEDGMLRATLRSPSGIDVELWSIRADADA